ncbi:beta-eliminating lyase-related protein [Lichenihabitans sp. Uapishka_5]|uniref:threonine aldolase family protein n=1 Tax=Lichenihabitans sp. Uapishka_5 TaxID=3037302 RepID=UPI0029E7F134|nr:aminotransferase class I/II-fold pyridoxal phosphate-dependent enzyme [Lichenihabitans sp. Uapishka_5]MDX7953163.1 beta-eliminating lyase-related protein [Lichenihabitans sp. Uapishka_5]
MHFASDNSSGASPRILDAVVRANAEVLPSYGADPHTAEAKRRIAEAFGAEPAVTLVATGTAANALALSAVVPPGGAVFCHAYAHILDEECAAPEFYTNGGKLVGVPGRDGKIDPDALRATLRRFPAGVARQAQGACLSLSQATESGTLYSPAEIHQLATIAHEAGLLVHMDGARFANAVAALGCAPADISHAAGVDILSLGASKNGAMICEAILVFDPARAATLPFRQKRGGHVVSKGRFLGAQMAAYLADHHWLDLARHANTMADRLATGLAAVPGVRMPWGRAINEVFPIMPAGMVEGLRAAGASFYDWDPATLPVAMQPGASDLFVRLLCSFATTPDEVDHFLEQVRALA